MQSARTPGCLALAVLACGIGAGAPGCWNDVELPVNSGSLGGQVLISGAVRGARIWIDQLDPQTGEVRLHLGETITDEVGRFALETGTEAGVFRITARGGSFDDLATGVAIALDDTDEMVSLISYDLLDLREDALVSPIGHLVASRAMERLLILGDMAAAFEEAKASLHGHFGNVDWGAVRPWPLDQPANSPTEPVRAAFVHAALSVLARDIAVEANAGPQEVNVYRLMQRWAEDVRAGTFDGNDGDDRTPGSGLQLGFCPPVDPGCAVPGAGCTTGRCRRPCDLYSGTPRGLLAGALIKLINGRDPRVLNRTGLDLSNTLSIVRAVSDNTDSALFDASCLEALDLVPPQVQFDSPTPGEAAFVRGSITIKAVATDDIDPTPETSLVGHVDLDGDPGNAVAWTTIDTAVLGDGPRLVVARAVDLTGNPATIQRALMIDNTAPVVTIDPTGFFIDGSTWWTASAAPVLTGTVTDASSVSIKAVIGGLEVAGVVAGATWTIALPPGVLDAGGTLVQIVAADAAGNQGGISRWLRPDVAPPVLSFQTSLVTDEDDEPVTFGSNHDPQHAHLGSPVDLATATACPSLTKFSYLLGSTSPEYAIELPHSNPILYQLVTVDPGVGIAAGATEYRVGLRMGPQTIWLLDWTSTGNGFPIGAGAGGTWFPVGIFSDVVPGLATTEGSYDVELRATDRLGRTTTAARCFDLHLRAPPLELEPPDPAQPTKVHAYALDSLRLVPGGESEQIAARLLNTDATGASLIDQDIFNGTTATIYLTVTVTGPSTVTAAQSFVLDNAPTQVTGTMCGACPRAEGGPEYTSPVLSTQAATLHYPAKVFELVGGVPGTEIPCLAPCPSSGTVFRFAIPPRASGGQPARAFRVMTMIGQVAGLWPVDPVHPASPPFEDTAITWTDPGSGATQTTRFTGIVDYSVDPARTGCVWPAGPPCMRQGTLVPYRALRSAALTFSSATKTTFETAATASLTPAFAAERSRDATLGWSAGESSLP